MQISNNYSQIPANQSVVAAQFKEQNQQEAEKQAIIQELEARGFYDIQLPRKGRYAIDERRIDGYVYHTTAKHPNLNAQLPPGFHFPIDAPIQIEIVVHRNSNDGPFPTPFYILAVRYLGGL